MWYKLFNYKVPTLSTNFNMDCLQQTVHDLNPTRDVDVELTNNTNTQIW